MKTVAFEVREDNRGPRHLKGFDPQTLSGFDTRAIEDAKRAVIESYKGDPNIRARLERSDPRTNAVLGGMVLEHLHKATNLTDDLTEARQEQLSDAKDALFPRYLNVPDWVPEVPHEKRREISEYVGGVCRRLFADNKPDFRRLWDFAYEVRKHSFFDNMRDFKSAPEVVRLLDSILDSLSEAAAPFFPGDPDRWKAWIGVEQLEAREAVLKHWRKIRMNPELEPVQQALNEAAKVPFILNDQEEREEEIIRRPGSDRRKSISHFISALGHLQLIAGRVGVCERKFAEFMGVSRNIVRDWKHRAASYGYLSLVEKSQGRGKCDTYRFRHEMFKAITNTSGEIIRYQSIRPAADGDPDKVIAEVPLRVGGSFEVTERFVVDLIVEYPGVLVRTEVARLLAKLRADRPPKDRDSAERYFRRWMQRTWQQKKRNNFRA